MTSQLFANTQIPCSLWFLSKNRAGGGGYRKRKGEVLFIDGRKLGRLIPGSRKQRQLSTDDIERAATVYRRFKREGRPTTVAGYCAVADDVEIRAHNYTLTPGRYVGSALDDEDDIPFDERLPLLLEALKKSLSDGDVIRQRVETSLARITNGH